MPSLLSDIPPRPPSVVAKATVSPPIVRLLPLTSRSWTVIVEVEDPSAVMDVGEALINEVPASAVPGTKLTTALSMIAAALTVPVMMAVPADVDEVRVAV